MAKNMKCWNVVNTAIEEILVSNLTKAEAEAKAKTAQEHGRFLQCQ